MHALIAAQGARDFDPERPPLAHLGFEVTAPRDGVVTGIDNLQIARIARLAGAPKMAGAGVDLARKLGDPVRAGEPLYRVYAEFSADRDFALQASTRDSGYRIGDPQEVPQVFVEL